MEPSSPEATDQSESSPDATLLLQRLQGHDAGSDAADALLELVYAQLRAIAGSYLHGDRPNHTLQPTALVHEAYLKIIHAPNRDWANSAHFCAVAATAMRQILSNHAAARRALKRGGPAAERVALDHLASPSGEHVFDVVALDAALTRLHDTDPSLGRIVELSYFGGLTHDQIAAELHISRSTVARGWRRARAFLNAELSAAEER